MQILMKYTLSLKKDTALVFSSSAISTIHADFSMLTNPNPGSFSIHYNFYH